MFATSNPDDSPQIMSNQVSRSSTYEFLMRLSIWSRTSNKISLPVAAVVAACNEEITEEEEIGEEAEEGVELVAEVEGEVERLKDSDLARRSNIQPRLSILRCSQLRLICFTPKIEREQWKLPATKASQCSSSELGISSRPADSDRISLAVCYLRLGSIHSWN